MRQHFDLEDDEPLVLVIDQDRHPLDGCSVLAESTSELAKIYDSLMMTQDGRTIRVTIVADEDQRMDTRVRRGWYVARYVSRPEAIKIETAWKML